QLNWSTRWRLVVQRNSRLGKPRRVRSSFTPPRGWSIQRQMVPVTTKERAMGSRKTVRKNPSPLSGRSSRVAKKSPIPKHATTKIRLKRSEEHTSELQSRENLVCRLLLEK